MERDIHVHHQCTVTEDIWSPWGSIRQESPYAAYCMPVGRWGHGAYVFRWSDLCWSSCAKASAIHVWAGNQGRQPCEKKLMRWSLVCLRAGRHMSASRHFLTWVALGESSWTFATALLNRGSKLMLQHGGERGIDKAVKWVLSLPAVWDWKERGAEVDRILTELKKIQVLLGMCSPWAESKHPDQTAMPLWTAELTHLCLWMLVCAVTLVSYGVCQC